MPISPQEAAAELLARRAARRSLIDFTTYTKDDFQVGEHHQEIASALESVESGECDRLMVFAPPRHTKSELASRRFPAWYMGKHPDRQLICATYSGDFALDFGREVRSIVDSQDYRNLFPEVSLASDSRAANRWHTTQGGVSVYVGVGGPITGRGAHVAIIDDPFKNREEADSEVRREMVWRWYSSTLRTRLMPRGAIVLVLTRWHEDDLAGRLLEQSPNEWKVIELPAIRDEAKPTERALWPAWYPIDVLKRIKADVMPRDWSALYQQRPSPDEGTYFKREWLKSWKEKPKALHIYGTSDYAVTDGGGDYTVHRVWGVDQHGDLYRLAGWRGQTSSDVWIERLIDYFKEYQPFAWFGESGVIQKAIEPMLKRRMNERGTYCRLEWLPSISDKPTRARGFQSRAAMGKVWFEPHADIDEHLKFPAGKHDDDVDCSSLIGRALDDAHPAVVAPKPGAQFIDRWDRVMNNEDEDADSWKVA